MIMDASTAQAILDVHEADLCECGVGESCEYWQARYFILAIETQTMIDALAFYAHPGWHGPARETIAMFRWPVKP